MLSKSKNCKFGQTVPKTYCKLREMVAIKNANFNGWKWKKFANVVKRSRKIHSEFCQKILQILSVCLKKISWASSIDDGKKSWISVNNQQENIANWIQKLQKYIAKFSLYCKLLQIVAGKKIYIYTNFVSQSHENRQISSNIVLKN